MSDNKEDQKQDQNVPTEVHTQTQVPEPVVEKPAAPKWRTDYAWYEYFLAPNSFEELNHRYRIMMRDIYTNFGLAKQDFPNSLKEYVDCGYNSVQDV